MRSSLHAVTAAAAGVVLLGLVGCSSPAEPTGPTELSIGVEPRAIAMSANPLDGTTRLYLLGWQPVYESLIVWDPEAAEFAPWLAEEFELSEDRLSLSLTLRDDVDFTDGVHFDAEALTSYLDVLFASPDAIYGGNFEGFEFEVTGEYTIEVTAPNPMDYDLLDTLADMPIASPEAVKDPETLATTPAGTGPYLLDELVPEVSISFVRNPDYWNPDAFDFDTITITSFEDRIAAFNALKSGQINATVLDTSMAAEAENEGFTLHTGGGAFAALILMDIDGSIVPALADKRVRQAINMAIDREGIVESLELGLGRVSSQIATEGQGHYVEDGDDRYPYDLDAAKELMTEAGYADGFDLVIPTVSALSVFPPQYEAIVQQSLADIGIRVTYEPQADSAAIFAALTAETYAAAIIRPAYSNIPPIIVGDEPLFPGFSDDPTLIELTTAAAEGTAEESDEALAELGEYILDEAWFAPISHPLNVWATNPDIDFTLGTLNSTAQLRLFTHTD